MNQLVKILVLGVVSGIKFATAAPIALASGFNYIETLAITTLGGILGVVFFFYLSQWLIRFFTNFRNKFFFLFGIKNSPEKRNSRAKVFTWKNRMIVKTVKRFGLLGIAVITPSLLSIPLGTFIATRYFRNKAKVLAYLCVSVVVWSAVLSSVVAIF